MIKAIFKVIFLTFFLYLSWILINYDGQIIIEWLDYRVEISTILTISLFITIVILIINLYNFINKITLIPNHLITMYRQKKFNSKFNNLIKGFGALAEENYQLAQSKNNQLLINNDNQDSHLINQIIEIFQVQVALVNNNNHEAEIILNKMLKHKQTELIALKGLIKIKTDSNKYNEAIELAKKAYNINPKLKWVLNNLIELYIYIKDWDKALAIINKSYKQKIIEESEFKKYFELVIFEKAESFFAINDIKESKECLIELLKVNQKNIKAIKLLVQIYCKQSKSKEAFKLIEKYWDNSIAEELIRLVKLISQDMDKNSLIEKLEQLKRNCYSLSIDLVIIDLLIDINDLNKARELIVKLIPAHEKDFHVAYLMAKLEAKSGAKQSIIYNWLNKTPPV